jgi:hypothetical protein
VLEDKLVADDQVTIHKVRNHAMKQGTKIGAFVLCLGLALANAGCAKKEAPQAVRDYNSIRADLRAQVEQGTLTREEAIVRLAEAQANTKSDARKKKKEGVSPELEAIGKDLKEQVAKGDMTGEEAMAAWIKAAGITKSNAKTKNTQDSPEEKK